MINLLKKASNIKGFFFNKIKNVEDLLKQIKNQQGKNLIETGTVVSHTVDNQKVQIFLKIDRDYRKVKSLIKDQLTKIGYTQIDIKLAPKQKQSQLFQKINIKNIKKIIAVSSCKGGVGKSTVAVSVASTLKQMGYKVGIFDSDIYGPSLPTLLGNQNTTLSYRQQNPKQIQPIHIKGLKCMSFGFVSQKTAVMRGPMISSIVSQLLYQTYWGQLDYLVIDMPPGTGDVQITLCQQVKFDGAIIVTTPQRLAYVDVIKGIQLFQDMRVKILGIVENMAYHECSKCKNQDLIFGRGYLNMLIQQFGIKNSVKIPLSSHISLLSDNGNLGVLQIQKQAKVASAYQDLVSKLIIQADKPYSPPIVHYNTANQKIIIEYLQNKKQISPYKLRLKCKCSICIDQFTGKSLLNIQKIDQEVYPSKIQQKGNYAISISWSDGHRNSIFPYERLLSEEIERTN